MHHCVLARETGGKNKAWGEGASRNPREDRQEFISPQRRAAAKKMGRFAG